MVLPSWRGSSPPIATLLDPRRERPSGATPEIRATLKRQPEERPSCGTSCPPWSRKGQGRTAQGLEQVWERGGGARAFEGDVESAATAGELTTSLDDLVTGGHGQGADLLGLGATVERNKQQKLDRITAAARELFPERGVDEVTTQEIADKADIGAGSCSSAWPRR